MNKISEKDGWVLYRRSDKEIEQAKPIALSMTAASAAAVTKPDPPTPPPEPAWNDPKSYNDAPFSVEIGNEDVILNSGAVQLTYDDLVLPGRNGFDLRLSRQYDSSKANTEDINLFYDDEDGDRWNSIVYKAKWQEYNPEMFVRVEDSFYFWESKTAMLNAIKKWYDDDPYWVEDYDLFPDGRGYYEGYIWTTPGKSNVFLRTSKRPNDHFKKLYGLGYGWRFMLPSIEKVLTQDYRYRYKTFVHFENGLSLPINEDDNGFEDYPLKDYTITKAGDAYTVGYKDGRKAYFNSSNQLTRMTDRFGNQISFAYDSTGRMNQITDSFGRVILMDLSGTTLTVKRQDTGEILMAYSVSASGELQSVTDAAGRATTYTYSQQQLPTQMSHTDSGDTSVDITFVNLTGILHPTGARTEYTYDTIRSVYPTPYEGKHNFFVLSARKDIPNPSSAAVVCNERAYTYDFTGEAKKTETDDDGALIYGPDDWGAPYMKQATVLSHRNAAGTYEVKMVTTFTEDGFKDDEIIYHIVNGAEKRVEQHEYSFTDRLLTLQLDSYLNYDYVDIYDKTNIWQRVTLYGYSSDKKGNPTQIKEEYPARTSCNQEKNYTYDANFSIPVEQSILTAEGRYTIIRDTMRAESDGKGKVPEFRRILEKVNGVETLKEKIQYAYDANFRVASEKHFYGDSLDAATTFVETAYTYGNYTDEPISQQVSGVADITGTLITSPNGAGVVKISAVHDWFGRAVSQTDPNGNSTATVYDGIGRVTLVTNPDATTKATAYDDVNNRVTVTDENGVARRYDYTPLGKISKDYILSPDTLLVAYQYDNLERLSTQINYGPDGQALATTSYSYDLFNQVLTKHTVGTGVDMKETHTFNRAYHSATQLECVLTEGDADAPTITKYVQTDPLGKVVTEQLGNLVTRYEYDRAGNRTLTLDPRGFYTQWEYDHASRVVREVNAVGNSIRTTYDALGRKIKVHDYAGNDSLFTYDAADHLIQQETPFDDDANALTRYFYDAAGNVLKQSVLMSEPDYEMGYNDEWRETQYTYDSRGRVLDTIQYDDRADEEIRTRFAYDGVGNKLSQYTGMLGNTTAGAALTTYTYNRFGVVLTMTDPLNQAESYSYDAIGRLTGKTDRNGNTTAYTYDAAGRILTETVTVNGVASTITHAYTRTGQKKSDTNDTLTITYKYDAMGRMIQQTESDGTVKAYQYDENGNRTQFFLIHNNVQELNQSYIYDQLNRLVEMGSDNTTIVKYSYDIMGNRTMTQYPQSGIYTGYQYNKANLVTLVDNYAGAENTSYLAYTYYLDGNTHAMDDADGSATSYRYDTMGRVFEEEDMRTGGFTKEYTFDRSGNRATMFVMNEDYDDDYEITYTYDLNNRLLSESKESFMEPTGTTTTSYTYDANGNQLTKVDVDGTEARGYNGFGQLVSISGLNGPAAYAYRPDGLRYSKVTGSGSAAVTHKQLWDGQNIVAEIGVSGTVNTRYIRGLNLVARKIDANHQYYQFNAHGDVLHLLDANGNLLIDYRFDSFGNQVDAVDSDTNPFRYCGEYFDKETKTYYLRARNYNPFTGRFTTQDKHWNVKNSIYGDVYVRMNGNTIVPSINAIRQSSNCYLYGLNNPMFFADPQGLRTYIINGINNPEETGVPEYFDTFRSKLIDKGIKDVRISPAFNKTNVFTGIWQVGEEMINLGRYASTLAEQIKVDLEAMPLEEGEELNLVGYSGGGQVALNAAELLSDTARVNNIVLIGTPVIELSIENTDRVVTSFSWKDPLSWNLVWDKTVTTKNFGNIGHTSYFSDENVSNTVSFVANYIN